MKERLIIILLAIVSGLIITTAAFFIYQSFTGSENQAQTTTPVTQTQQEGDSDLLLEVEEPANESLTDNRTISVRGTTNPENLVVVSSNSEDISGKPTTDGKFSLTVDIDAGANILVIRSIGPDGSEIREERVVTYNTEEF